MRATKRNNDRIQDCMTVDTPNLQEILQCGRKTAVQIGLDAGAKVVIGRRVLWNLSKIQKHLDKISATK